MEHEMQYTQDRRQFLQLLGLGGGVVFASGLAGSPFRLRPVRSEDESAGAPSLRLGTRTDDFFFLQLSDTHWGFSGPAVNPEADKTLKKAVATINESDLQPDFIVFTGDLTHTTDDGDVRRKRMGEFKEIVGNLKVKTLKFMPGEHDASLDQGKAFEENFGATHYSFDHKGIHFVTLDNVSDPGASVGDKQIEWLKSDLAKVEAEAPVVVLTHRPLFDLYPQWDWSTRDGAQVIDVLQKHKNVTVFYGHIHQENHHTTGAIEHHSAKSLIFPLPAPGSVPKKAPIPWDAAKPFNGLGYRRVDPKKADVAKRITEMPVVKA
jgi:3',5'-cyclic AMP phosphodiesterase CpdA